jgi:hypothetical protein
VSVRWIDEARMDSGRHPSERRVVDTAWYRHDDGRSDRRSGRSQVGALSELSPSVRRAPQPLLAHDQGSARAWPSRHLPRASRSVALSQCALRAGDFRGSTQRRGGATGATHRPAGRHCASGGSRLGWARRRTPVGAEDGRLDGAPKPAEFFPAAQGSDDGKLRDSFAPRPHRRLYTSRQRAGRIQSAERAVPTLESITAPNEPPLAWRRRTSGCNEGSFVWTSGDYPRTPPSTSTKSSEGSAEAASGRRCRCRTPTTRVAPSI